MEVETIFDELEELNFDLNSVGLDMYLVFEKNQIHLEIEDDCFFILTKDCIKPVNSFSYRLTADDGTIILNEEQYYVIKDLLDQYYDTYS